MGDPGTGKTYALSTLAEAGLELFVVGTESRFLESITDSFRDRKIDLKRLHYKLIRPTTVSFSKMIQAATFINTMTFESLAKLSDIGKNEHGQFIQLLSTLSNFTDQHGTNFGSVDTWGADKAIVIDSLSGLNIMAMDLVTGLKPVKSQPDWQIAMDNLERLINKLTSDTRCFFVLTAHLDREPDEITGGTTIQAGALGRKLSPKIPRFFSEVIRTYREGERYYWSTASAMYTLKKRALPLGERLEPSFKPIVQAWHNRLKELRS